MSSFLGHAITGFAIAKFSPQKNSWLWLGWLTFLAMSPDVSYLFIWLFEYQSIIDYTHSIGFASILPIITSFILWLKKIPQLKQKILLMFAAAYSHLVLDLLVGVFPKPLLWPFYGKKVTLPFGVLPSAGALYLSNFYLWRNLLIELGILLPMIGLVYLWINRKLLKWKKAGLMALFLIMMGH